MQPRHLLLPLAFAGLAACSAVDDADVADHHDHEEETVGSTSSPLVASDPVSAAVTQSCTTTAVKGLATQLVEEIQCLRPGTMKRIDGTAGLSLGSAVFPYLQTPAANALVAAQKARGVTMSINSGLRTLPQQYLLYRWYQTGRCGIGLAARPGTSNHESAVAVDINDNAGWRTSMQNKSFRWLGASDPVHFDYVGGGAVDLRGLSVKAFQRLWNRNHPTDTIAEDGVYGPATEARLAQSPVGGFAKGATCTNMPKPDAGADAGGMPTMSGGDDDPADPPPAIPDATEPASDDPATKDTQGAEIGAPVSAPYDRVNDGCSTSPSRAFVGAGPLLLVMLSIAGHARRRRRCAD